MTVPARRLAAVALAVLLVAIALQGQASSGFRIDLSKLSVSGLSAGGYMAVQYHVAYSSELIGVGVFAGGPYWCANDNIDTATTACMSTPELISTTELIAATDYAATLDSIDSPKNLANSQVFLFSGTLDTVVNQGVMQKLLEYYAHYVPQSNIATVFNVSAEHSMPTLSFGNLCSYLGTPFMNDCAYDGAGAALQHIYGAQTLTPPGTTAVNSSNIVAINQKQFVDPVLWATASLDDQAYVYVPTACWSNTTECLLHVVFHGCEQTFDKIGSEFFTSAGYNPWAEQNNIVVLYPQAKVSEVVPYNPKGCFDWWGYSGEDYATKLAAQILAVHKMVEFLSTK